MGKGARDPVYNESEFSITIAKLKANIPLEWFNNISNHLVLAGAVGLFSLECGTRVGNLHSLDLIQANETTPFAFFGGSRMIGGCAEMCRATRTQEKVTN